jgi:hypothetical protein
MKTKNWISLFVAFIFLLSLFLTSGCASVNQDKNGTANDATAPGYGNETATSSGATASGLSDNAALSDRKVIFTASLEIETTDYAKSITVLEKMIADYEGYIQSSHVETGTSYWSSIQLRTATYTIRIPADKLDAFVAQSGDIGNIIVDDSSGEDVTDKFYDTKAHLEALTTQEDRLLELLKDAKNLTDILALEDRLASVRYEIEILTGTLNELTSLIELSTVTIEISEVESITVTPNGFWEQIQTTFDESIKALISTLRVISLILVAIAPFILVFGLILLLIILIWRRATRKKRQENKAYRTAVQANFLANSQMNASANNQVFRPMNQQANAPIYNPPAAPADNTPKAVDSPEQPEQP